MPSSVVERRTPDCTANGQLSKAALVSPDPVSDRVSPGYNMPDWHTQLRAHLLTNYDRKSPYAAPRPGALAIA